MTQHLFLINPASGKKGSTEALTRFIDSKFPAMDLPCRIQLTQEPGQAEHLAREAGQTGNDLRIYACGGDGTLNEVVNGVAGMDNVAVTNVPKGTGNDFIKIFGADYRRAFCDLPALATGPQTAFDLMDCNGRLGIDVVCAGVDARVANDVVRFKNLPLVRGPGAYVMALADNVLFHGMARRTKISIGDMEWDEDITILCVCNGRHYGGGFMPVGDAMPDDGILDMLVIPKVSLPTFARLVGDYAKGNYKKHPDLIHPYRGQTVTFSSPDEMLAVVDGEVMRGTHFTVSLSEKKVNFFYPHYVNYQPKGSLPEGAVSEAD